MDSVPHCSCLCYRNDRLNNNNNCDVSIVQLSDKDIEDGRTQQDDGVTDDILLTVDEPVFDDETVKRIKLMQTDSEIAAMIEFVGGGASRPSKQSSLTLPNSLSAFFHHFQLFGT